MGAYPRFELGAVPPIGGSDGDLVLGDSKLREHDAGVLEAGTRQPSIDPEAVC